MRFDDCRGMRFEDCRGMRFEDCRGMRFEDCRMMRFEDCRAMRFEDCRMMRFEDCRSMRFQDCRMMRFESELSRNFYKSKSLWGSLLQILLQSSGPGELGIIILRRISGSSPTFQSSLFSILTCVPQPGGRPGIFLSPRAYGFSPPNIPGPRSLATCGTQVNWEEEGGTS